MADAVLQLLDDAILGPVVVALAVAYGRLQKKYNELQDQRVEDAEKYATKLLATLQAIRENTETLKAIAPPVQQLVAMWIKHRGGGDQQ